MDFSGNQTVQGPNEFQCTHHYRQTIGYGLRMDTGLVPIEVHYMEKNPGMFSSKPLISSRLKKERHGHLG